MFQSLTKCSRVPRPTATLAFESATHAPKRFYATTANRDIVNLLNERASSNFYPSITPTPFALTFGLVVLPVLVDRCGG